MVVSPGRATGARPGSGSPIGTPWPALERVGVSSTLRFETYEDTCRTPGPTRTAAAGVTRTAVAGVIGAAVPPRTLVP
ncbi:hypothetical protein GCM10010280_54650 [Streptomyces pilosus]|uniref:Uncharacterized protein n=1 Tax=Streptomyces pilosus TaxID=28893 RepID=A0A918F1N4_9ACTN|nr:hypothetical protein GCM10010280_54650 [Streptomyces pilosus]